MPNDCVLKDNNNGDLLSEDNGFVDEVFGHEWEIVREPGVDPALEHLSHPGSDRRNWKVNR
jgi:hypothetical protein